MNARVDLIIHGRVQGVFFRGSAAAEAERLGIAGEVRNLSDGTVQAVAQGPREAVEEFVAWCRHGPPGARVDEVEETWSLPTGEFQAFRVAR